MSGPFVRKNILVATATFTPTTGDDAPSSAFCVLNFNNLSDVQQQVSIPMTPTTDADDDVMWSASWDSSAAGPGPVSWMIYCNGGLQAAAQGEFSILANPANNV